VTLSCFVIVSGSILKVREARDSPFAARLAIRPLPVLGFTLRSSPLVRGPCVALPSDSVRAQRSASHPFSTGGKLSTRQRLSSPGQYADRHIPSMLGAQQSGKLVGGIDEQPTGVGEAVELPLVVQGERVEEPA